MTYSFLILATLIATAFGSAPAVIAVLALMTWTMTRSPLMLCGLTLLTIAAIGLEDSILTPNGGWILAGFAGLAAGAVPGALREQLRFGYGLTLAGGLLLSLAAFFTPIPASWLASLLAIGVMGSIIGSWRLVVEAYPLRAPILILPALSGVAMGYWGGGIFIFPILTASIILLASPNRISAIMAAVAAGMGTALGTTMGAPSLTPLAMEQTSFLALVFGIILLIGLATLRISQHGWAGRMWGWTTLLFLSTTLFFAQGPALAIMGLMAGLILASIPYDLTPLLEDPVLKAWRKQKVTPTDLVTNTQSPTTSTPASTPIQKHPALSKSTPTPFGGVNKTSQESTPNSETDADMNTDSSTRKEPKLPTLAFLKKPAITKPLRATRTQEKTQAHSLTPSHPPLTKQTSNYPTKAILRADPQIKHSE